MKPVGTSVKTLDRHTLTIPSGAAANWTTGTVAGGLTLTDDATLNNAGTFTLQTDEAISGTGILSVFNNTGTFRMMNTTATTTVGVQFNNSGLADVESGTLTLNGGGTSSGTFTVANGATLNFGGGLHELTSSSMISGNGSIGFSAGGVDEAGSYGVNGGTAVVGTGGVTFWGTVTSVGSSLTIANTAAVDFGLNSITVPTVTMSGGTLLGVGNVDVTGSMSWTGGTMGDLGSTTIDNGATLSMMTGAARTLDGRTLNINNMATANWTTGTIDLNHGAVINNQAGATFLVQVDTTLSTGGQLAVFNNAGLFLQQNSTGTTTIATQFNNTGTVDVRTGTLVLSLGGVSGPSAVYTVESIGGGTPAATLSIAGGTQLIAAGTTVSGAGNVVFTGNVLAEVDGTYNVTGSTTFNGTISSSSVSVIFLGTVPNVGSSLTITSTSNGSTIVNFGTNSITTATCNFSGNSLLQGSGDVGITGLMTWAGGTMADLGSTTIAPGATLTINGAALKALDGRALNISATAAANWLETGNIALNNGAVLNNAGTFNDQTQQAISTAGVLGVINNSGLFSQVSNTGMTTLGTRFNNTGMVDVQTGTLVLSLGGVSGSGSAFTVEASATLTFGGGLYDIGAGATLGGAGRVVFSAGNTRIDGTYNVTGSTAFSGSSVARFFGSVTAVGSSLSLAGTSVANFGLNSITTSTATISGGFLEGIGDVNVTTSLSWSGGTLYGRGSVTVGTGSTPATLTMTGSSSLDGRTLNLTNMTTATWMGTSGTLAFSDAAVLNLLSGAIFNAENNQSTFSGSGVVNNAGTFRKTTSTGPTTISLPFNNSGQVQVSTGSMIFAGGGTSTGNFNVSGTPTAPPTLTFGGGIHQLLAGSSITGSGTSNMVTFTGGEVDIFGNVSVTGPVNVSGASTVVYFLHNAATGVFINGGGTVAVEPGNTLTITGAYTQSSGTTDVNAATLTATNVNIMGGTLFASGTINAGTVTNAGTLSLGAAVTPGVLTINGNYAQSGVLNIKVGGPGPNQFDQLNVAGNVTLNNGSRLNASFIGAVPPVGSRFQVITWTGSLTNHFTSLGLATHFVTPPEYNSGDVTLVTN